MSTRRPLSAMAAILVAATALAACGPGVAGDTPAGRDTGSEKAAVAARQPVYQDVSGQGVELPRDDVDKAQFSGVPVPGAALLAWGASDEGSMCTLGVSVTVAGRPAFVTAGHCETQPAGGAQQLVAEAKRGGRLVDLGPLGRVKDEKDDPSAGGILEDAAVVHTPAGSPARIAGTWPIVGSMSIDETRALPIGTPICVDGAKSGVRCSALISAPGDRIRFSAITVEGDSGAPVFVVAAGAATVIGIHKGLDDLGASTATFIEPALARMGATLLTAH
ncbi:hypothetical protein [Tsukamurella pulmonis]|uniref:hypothetical protein n=1 Tax=Tsukamurella pulmonis TaxID=47312 RepID=UPI001401F146|nr:hypothetical protein [Tsukamurella pulmonis]